MYLEFLELKFMLDGLFWSTKCMHYDFLFSTDNHMNGNVVLY